jgi:hypothetical protein
MAQCESLSNQLSFGVGLSSPGGVAADYGGLNGSVYA